MEKILPSDLVNKGVIGLPDTPGLDTTQMQQKFDEIALDVIIPHYNDLIDELEETILPATGDMKKSVYDTDNDGKVDAAEDADTVNSHTVESDVPADAVFTDTTYTAGDNITIDENNEISATDTTYTAGSNISISAQNEISADLSSKMDTDGSNADSDVTFAGTLTVGSRESGETVGKNSSSFGGRNIASGNYSHAEGNQTTASNAYSHAEGFVTTASGMASHAEGSDATASGAYSHAEGFYTTAGYNYQHVQGKYNDNKSATLFEIGNGTSSTHNNAFEVYSDGSLSQDNGSTKFRFTEVSGQKGYYDENGTFNAFGSGGGGSSTLAGLQDVSISGTPSNGEILKYNSTSSKWENGTETAQVQADWNQATSTAVDYIKNKPTIPDAQIQSDWNQSDNTAKDFIKNKPTIPSAQVNSDWNAASGVAQILNKPTLATVATSGSYADLSNKPTIPDEISELGDVSISSLTNGQILKYNSTSQKWENSAAGGGGDMQASTYDPNGTVATAGGIVAYIDDTITAALTASY